MNLALADWLSRIHLEWTGKMQQAGSDRIIIRPLSTENFLFYFPVAMYTLLLRNIGMMKNENDKLLKQKGVI